MDRKVLVRYGEIALKSPPVRREFLENLVSNIEGILKGISFSIRMERGRIFVSAGNLEMAAERISNLPGVVSTSPVWQVDADLDEIREGSKELAREIFPSDGSFAIRARRTGNHDFDSNDIEDVVGSAVLEEKSGLEVDLDSPDYTLSVEVRPDSAYLFTETVDGTGGLPVGSQNRFVLPFSGTDRDLLCGFSLMKRGAAPGLVHLTGWGDVPRNFVSGRAEKLLKFHPELSLHFVPGADLLTAIEEGADEKLEWLLRKRISLQISELMANETGSLALASVEDMDSLASIGLKNLRIIEAPAELPVLHPLSLYSSSEIGKVLEDRTGIKPHDGGSKFTKGGNRKDQTGVFEKVRNFESDVSLDSLLKSAVEERNTVTLEV